jgi:D-alanyl-lipoteichoic acid acyltransferase DltB (MBOAT superfamily)
MVITSIKFLIFCICAVGLFLIFPPKYRWVSLLASSVAFYFINANWMIGFSLVTSMVVFVSAGLLEKTENEGAARQEGKEKAEVKEIKKQTSAKKKGILVITLVFVLGILIVYKVLNHFSEAFTYLAGFFSGGEAGSAIKLIVPLGISYYTFSTVGYLLDVYWKRYETEKNPLRFYLYTIYFPHIMQGPISRYPLLGQQLKKPELRLRWDNFVVGMESILLGMFKKLVIADRAGEFVSATLSKSGMGGKVYIVCLILDAIQIYTDFSGYMDIVSGVSKIFDVELEQNFNHPFMAKSVPEFWRRWHMSLGGWFKDYVYYPVNMSKAAKNINKKIKGIKLPHLKKALSVCLPVMVTWILTGLWHGSGRGYVAWGLYYGTLILLSVTFYDDIVAKIEGAGINRNAVWYRALQTIKIFCIFMGGRFLASTIKTSQKLRVIKAILKTPFKGNLLAHKLNTFNFGILIFGVVVLIIIAIIEQKESIFDWLNRKNKIVCAVILYVLFFAVFLFGIYGSTDSGSFMYQQY